VGAGHFNLTTDIGEENNLVDAHPDVACRLAGQLARFLKQVTVQMPSDKETGEPVPLPNLWEHRKAVVDRDKVASFFVWRSLHVGKRNPDLTPKTPYSVVRISTLNSTFLSLGDTSSVRPLVAADWYFSGR